MDVSVSRTLMESRRLVSQQHVNPLGTLYGGYMLEWVVDAGTVAAMNFVESDVAPGYSIPHSCLFKIVTTLASKNFFTKARGFVQYS